MTPQGGVAEAERRRAAGRMKSPEAVTEQKAGYKTADTCRINISSASWLRKFTAIAAPLQQPKTP
jgi:hypothetical protein